MSAGKSNTYSLDLLKLAFNATAIANIADNAGTSPLTNLYVALHTADPGETGDQTTNECSYTSYARVAVARTSGGWTCSGTQVVPAATITFPASTGGGDQTATHFSVGVASSGASKILYYGAIGTDQGVFTAVASTDIITAPNYTSPTNGDKVSFYARQGFSLPTGLTEGTVYFVVSASGQTFKVSTTSGGSAVDITGDGGGYVYKDPGIFIQSAVTTPRLTTSSVINED